MQRQKKATSSNRGRQLWLVGAAATIVTLAIFLAGQNSTPERPSGPTAPSAQNATPVAGTSQPTAPQQTAKTPVVQPNGMLIFIDPQTGLPREGTPEEYQALNAPTQRQPAVSADLPSFVTPEGAVGIRLPESFDSSVVATRNADGTVSFSEVASSKKASPAVEGSKGVSTTRKEVPSDH